jgi:hypothetical protein
MVLLYGVDRNHGAKTYSFDFHCLVLLRLEIGANLARITLVAQLMQYAHVKPVTDVLLADAAQL